MAKNRSRRRRGALIVYSSLLFVVLIGMVGLVIDGGLLMSSFRHAQNAADAAALAAAMAKMRGLSDSDAETAAVTYVTGSGHNQVSVASGDLPITRIPPVNGGYTGANNYVEAIVKTSVQSYFIHVLPGIGASRFVTARAVAGYELVAAGEGVMTLNPNAEPGLKVTGNGSLCVDGGVLVNSEGGGTDQYGNDYGTGSPAIAVSNNATIKATNVDVVGGVDRPDNIDNVDPSGPDPPLNAGQTTFPDPLVDLSTPTVSNGVVNVLHGSPQATSGGYALNIPAGSPSANFIEDPGGPAETMVLHPGIYEQIQITGGTVRLEPGIYVLSPPSQATPTWVVDITGGTVTANGIMFYNTGSNYDPVTGWPDTLDGNYPPPASESPTPSFGGVKINAGLGFTGLNDPSSEFDNMLFYQRRRNTERMQIEGNSASGDLNGTLYSKWGEVSISGQGTYDAQFVVGQMEITGNGDVTINYNGNNVGKAPQVFLVD